MKKITPKKNDNLAITEYAQFLDHIKSDIQQAQLRAATAVTKELTHLYWRIGKALLEKIRTAKWGAKVVAQLAHDLNIAFPGMAGFSLRNIEYMRKFAENYPETIFATVVAKLPWGHNIVLLEKLDNDDKRLW
jgi:predicted nuclease of restriction endonuclease-like (RecB) superfamily